MPCFALAKILKKAPIQIANEIKESYKQNELIEKIEVVNGYVNFYLNQANYIKQVLLEIDKNTPFLPLDEYKNKIVCLDYSSVNLAKYMHIGHLSTTVIGESLARIYESLGYKPVRINYIGDYGTPFGKMIYAYLTWGENANIEEKGIDFTQDLYVKFCKCAEDDKDLEEKAREYFKKVEDKDPKIYKIYERIINASKKETENILDILGVKFDSWKGENSYSDELDNVLKLIESHNLLKESNGAKVVDLEEYGLGACLVQKSDGTSLYATRDIAAAIDRYEQYKFDKMLYVTAVQQKLHFQQFFKVLELMNYPFSKNLVHVYYGMFSLPTGKIASRKGKQAVLKDLMQEAYNKAYKMVENRNFDNNKKQEIANKISLSALRFNAIKTERIKDTVFDLENAFSFEGDTSAYLQYTYTRLCSILRKAEFKNAQPNFEYLNNSTVFDIVLALNNYQETIIKAMQQNEPSVICKYTIDLCKLINKFYNAEKVVTDNEEETQSKLWLINNLQKTLNKLFNLICIDPVEEM